MCGCCDFICLEVRLYDVLAWNRGNVCLIECENVKPVSSGWPLEGKAYVGIKLEGCYYKVNLAGVVGEILFSCLFSRYTASYWKSFISIPVCSHMFTEREKPIYGKYCVFIASS